MQSLRPGEEPTAEALDALGGLRDTAEKTIRYQILEAMWNIRREGGVEQITPRQIADRAGLDRKQVASNIHHLAKGKTPATINVGTGLYQLTEHGIKELEEGPKPESLKKSRRFKKKPVRTLSTVRTTPGPAQLFERVQLLGDESLLLRGEDGDFYRAERVTMAVVTKEGKAISMEKS